MDLQPQRDDIEDEAVGINHEITNSPKHGDNEVQVSISADPEIIGSSATVTGNTKGTLGEVKCNSLQTEEVPDKSSNVDSRLGKSNEGPEAEKAAEGKSETNAIFCSTNMLLSVSRSPTQTQEIAISSDSLQQVQSIIFSNDSNSNAEGSLIIPVPVTETVMEKLSTAQAFLGNSGDVSDSGESQSYILEMKRNKEEFGDCKNEENTEPQPLEANSDHVMPTGHHPSDFVQASLERDSVVINNFDSRTMPVNVNSNRIHMESYENRMYPSVIRAPPEEYLYHPNHTNMVYRFQPQPPVHIGGGLMNSSPRQDYIYGENMPYAQISIEKIQNPGHWGSGPMSIAQSEKGCTSIALSLMEKVHS
jgi:hypothetical protein